MITITGVSKGHSTAIVKIEEFQKVKFLRLFDPEIGNNKLF
jgi:hypothetical protein